MDNAPAHDPSLPGTDSEGLVTATVVTEPSTGLWQLNLRSSITCGNLVACCVLFALMDVTTGLEEPNTLVAWLLYGLTSPLSLLILHFGLPETSAWKETVTIGVTVLANAYLWGFGINAALRLGRRYGTPLGNLPPAEKKSPGQ